jgi:hypothetical protein
MSVQLLVSRPTHVYEVFLTYLLSVCLSDASNILILMK